MKKEMSAPAIAGIGAVSVLIIGGVVWMLLGKGGTSDRPSAELLEKQIAYQKSLIPGGGKAVPPNAGFQSEMDARAKLAQEKGKQ